jgi:hypothetical protein
VFISLEFMGVVWEERIERAAENRRVQTAGEAMTPALMVQVINVNYYCRSSSCLMKESYPC